MANLFKNILVPFDNSANSLRALNKAIAVANLSDAKITLVHVISYHKAAAKIIGPYKNSLITHVTKFMDQAKNYSKKVDVETEDKILYGSPAEEILNLMKKKKFDLVVVGRRGTSKLTGQYIGSVTNALIQNSKVPILVIT